MSGCYGKAPSPGQRAKPSLNAHHTPPRRKRMELAGGRPRRSTRPVGVSSEGVGCSPRSGVTRDREISPDAGASRSIRAAPPSAISPHGPPAVSRRGAVCGRPAPACRPGGECRRGGPFPSAGRMIRRGGHARIGRERLWPPPRGRCYDVGSHLEWTARKGVWPWLTAERARGAPGRSPTGRCRRPRDRSRRTCSVRGTRARRRRRATGPPLRPTRGWTGRVAATAPPWAACCRSRARGCGRRPAGSGPGAWIPSSAPRTSSRAPIRRPPGPSAGAPAETSRASAPGCGRSSSGSGIRRCGT